MTTTSHIIWLVRNLSICFSIRVFCVERMCLSQNFLGLNNNLETAGEILAGRHVKVREAEYEKAHKRAFL